MTQIKRPDLSQASQEIRDYVEWLETELATAQQAASPPTQPETAEGALSPEAPTTFNLVTLSRNGMIKRTPRHLYARQHRAGMGVFDLDIPETDAPLSICTADQNQDLLLITEGGHAFRLPLRSLPESPVRDRGGSISEFLSLPAGESLKVILPAQDGGYLALLSGTGYVRLLRHNYMGETMQPGTTVFEVGKYGPVAAGSWTSGQGDVLITTRLGMGIRFRQKLVLNSYGLGIRLDRGDEVVSIAQVSEDSGIFLGCADGKGTIRMMAGFNANKEPGGSGKITMKTDHLVGAISADMDADIFMITQLSKIIRFPAAEIPPKMGVVQGVNCMSLRADRVVAVTK